ncbi:hypothetical protein PGT21_016834 [Puccinia graminis f. sp. tritici]|uniref:Uncharacterized protein n=1 Tax=Puccinia graminis f. sp. tritici TaxID=56615 RepID=A0A5B0MJ57_PUCGR|nr:hypothetical protein PGT21_016834 [Puccinia graminis f. sp. tritici]
MILPSSSIQSYYAVMIVMVVRSVRLTESPVRHHDRAGASLVRRARGNEPPQTCESCFAIAGPDNFARQSSPRPSLLPRPLTRGIPLVR